MAPKVSEHNLTNRCHMAQDEMGIDAVKWAAEFNRIAVTLGYSEMDEGWLIGWFANAIMRGYDAGRSVERKLIAEEARHGPEDV